MASEEGSAKPLPTGRLDLAVQYTTERRGVPHRRSVERWLRAALEQPASITVRFAGRAEVTALNGTFRGQHKATNVLSFAYTGVQLRKVAKRSHAAPAKAAAGRSEILRGDIVLCPQVVRREAIAQRKSPTAHYAHMIVHGALHLQGYDHRTAAEANVMEDRERAILASLGYPDPY